jgi:glutamate/aspartate transport system substrate-binding protein
MGVIVGHVFSAFLFVLAFAASHASAEEGTLKQIQDNKVVRLGYLKEAVPFSFADSVGKPMGYSIDLCQRVVAGIQHRLQVTQLDVKWIEVTTANRFERVANGTVDLECGTSTITLSRQRQVDFSLMTWADGGTFLVKPDQPVKALIDLSGKKIAVLEGTTTEKALRQALSDRFVNAQVLLVKEHLEGLNALANGTVDAFAGDQTVLVGLALAVGTQIEFTLAEIQFSFEPYGLTLRRNDADFKLVVNEVLARLYRTGQIEEIYERWFGKLGKPSPAIFAVYHLNGLPE